MGNSVALRKEQPKISAKALQESEIIDSLTNLKERIAGNEKYKAKTTTGWFNALVKGCRTSRISCISQLIDIMEKNSEEEFSKKLKRYDGIGDVAVQVIRDVLLEKEIEFGELGWFIPYSIRKGTTIEDHCRKENGCIDTKKYVERQRSREQFSKIFVELLWGFYGISNGNSHTKIAYKEGSTVFILPRNKKNIIVGDNVEDKPEIVLCAQNHSNTEYKKIKMYVLYSWIRPLFEKAVEGYVLDDGEVRREDYFTETLSVTSCIRQFAGNSKCFHHYPFFAYQNYIVIEDLEQFTNTYNLSYDNRATTMLIHTIWKTFEDQNPDEVKRAREFGDLTKRQAMKELRDEKKVVMAETRREKKLEDREKIKSMGKMSIISAPENSGKKEVPVAPAVVKEEKEMSNMIAIIAPVDIKKSADIEMSIFEYQVIVVKANSFQRYTGKYVYDPDDYKLGIFAKIKDLPEGIIVDEAQVLGILRIYLGK